MVCTSVAEPPFVRGVPIDEAPWLFHVLLLYILTLSENSGSATSAHSERILCYGDQNVYTERYLHCSKP